MACILQIAEVGETKLVVVHTVVVVRRLGVWQVVGGDAIMGWGADGRGGAGGWVAGFVVVLVLVAGGLLGGGITTTIWVDLKRGW